MDVSMVNDARQTPEGDAGGTERRPTVLVVDDSERGRHAIAELLKATQIASDTLTASDGLQALRIMKQQPVDLVICDLNMPRCDGIAFLRLKAVEPDLEPVPVIMLTGAEDVPRKIEALTRGASDYITKPCDVTEIAARVSIHVKIRNLQAKLTAANTELTRLSLTDPLTGVGDRRHFDRTLEEEFLRARRYDRPLSLGMLDIDHFAHVNATHGQLAGDAALATVATVCRRSLRRCDTVARCGGEEFALILPETPIEGARLAVDRLREAVAAAPVRLGETSFTVTVSIGVASFPHPLVTRPHDLVVLADAAVYDAKQSGRNRVMLAR